MAEDRYSQNRQLAYDLLKKEGYTDIGDSAEELFSEKSNSELAYKLLSEAGYTDIGKDYNEFAGMLYAPETDAATDFEGAATRVEAQPAKKPIDPASAAEGKRMFEARRPVQGMGVDAIANANGATAPAQEEAVQDRKDIVEDSGEERQALVAAVQEANAAYKPIIDEYEQRWNKYQQDTDNELSGPEIDAEKAWLDENNAAYREAKNAIAEANGRLNLYDKPREIERLRQKRADARKYMDPSMVVATGMTPFGRDNTGKKSERASEYAKYSAADEMLSMAEQTLNQGSKVDPGYEGNWMEQLWTGVKQFGEGAANNVDKGSFTLGLSEGVSLREARKVGEKYNALITDTIKSLGIKEEDVDKILADPYSPKYKALMGAVANAIDEDLTDGEKAVLDAFDEFTNAKMRRADDVSVASAAGAGAEQSAEFMLDFILTGGLKSVGAKAATKIAANRLLKKLGEGGAKWAGRIASDAGVAALRTTAMFPRNLQQYGEQLTAITGKDALGRYDFSRSKLNAALNTALTQYIEYWSEGFGEYFGAAEQSIFKKATKAAPHTLIGKTLGQYRGSIGKYLDYGKFDGMFNEMLEEVVGSTFDSLAGWATYDKDTDKSKLGNKDALKEFFAGEQLATLALSFLPMSAISASTNLRAYNKMKQRYNEGINALNPFLQNGTLKQDDLAGLVSDIENKTPEQIKDDIVSIADKVRGANKGYLPADFAKNLLGYVEGTFAMNMNNQVWEDSFEKMNVVNAYTESYEHPDERNAWDFSKLESEAREGAKAIGVDDATLDMDAYAIAKLSQDTKDSNPEQSNALLRYAMAKAQMQGLKDGYNEETKQMSYARGERIKENLSVHGNVITANGMNGMPVYIVTTDASVSPDGKLTTPGGEEGIVAFTTDVDGDVQTAKANQFTGAKKVDLDTYLVDEEDKFYAQRDQAWDDAVNNISATGMAQQLYDNIGNTVYVHGSGAYEPVTIVRITNGGASAVITGDKEALKGIALAAGIESPGGTNLELPVEVLWGMLDTDQSGNLVTENPQEATAENAAGAENAGATTAATDADVQKANALVGTTVNIRRGGSTTPVDVIDVNGGNVWYEYDNETGERRTSSMPISDFINSIDGNTEVAESAGASETETTQEQPAAREEAPASKIPTDKNGNKIYDAPGVEPIDAYEDMYSTEGLSEEDVDEWVISQSDEAEKNRNPKIKKGQSLAEWGAAKTEANRIADFWKELREVAEDHVKERGAKAKAESERQAQIEKYGVDTRNFDLTPQTAEEAVAEYLGNNEGIIDLDDAKKETFGKKGSIPMELFRHLGNGGILVKNGGRSIQDVANDIVGEYENTVSIDQDTARQLIIDYLTRYTKTEMREMVFNNRLASAIAELEQQNGTSSEVEDDLPEAEEDDLPAGEETTEAEPTETEGEGIPASEAVEEAPEGTEVPETEEQVKTESPASEEDDLPAGEPEGKSGAESAGNEGKDTGKSGGKTVPSHGEGKNVPATAAEIKTKEQARAYFEGLYGKGKRADNSVRVWELTHKKKSAPKQEDGMVSKMAMSIANETGLTDEEAAELITLGTQLAEDFIVEDGFVKYPQFFKNLVETFGDGIRPFSAQIYLGASANVSDDLADQMDDRKSVRAFDPNTDLNDISDEQESNAEIRPEPGTGNESVADTDGGRSEEEPEGNDNGPDTGASSEDSGEGGNEVGVLDGGNDTESDSGADWEGTDGTPGRGGRGGRKSDDGVSTGKGPGRRRGPGQRSAEPGEGAGRDTGRVEDTEAEKEARAKAQEDAAYEAEKERIKDETDTKKLKSLKDEIKSKLSSITDKYDEVRAKLNGQLRAILEKLQELFSNNANKSESLAQEKVPYAPVSDPEGTHSVGSVVPSGAADYMRDAVKRLEAEVGKTAAEYVKDELGYKDLDEMFTFVGTNNKDSKDIGISGEQVDAVALAIHQMNNGRIFVVGDMTGVGKGRIGAALIRWAKRHGKKVVFCTEQPNLFTAMYNDIADIGGLDRKGAKDPVPWIIGNGKEANITDEDENILVSTPSDNEIKSLYSSGKDELPVCPGGRNRGNIKGRQYDFVMTTYSQLQATEEEEEGDSEKVKKKNERNTKGRQRLDWLKKYATDAIVIMDESHTAAGQGSTRGENAKKLVEVAKGVTFMSATFAKTPQAMGLYAIRSSMNDAMITRDQLIAAIDRYGIPMQEILASALFKTGEMVRRERDFEGVKTNWMAPEESYSEEEIQNTQSLSDKTVDVINAIIDFQRRYVDPVIDKLNKKKKEENEIKLASGAQDVYIEEYSSTPYSGQVSNVVGMMLFALKAKKAAEIAIEQIKKGEKPVIAVDNTLGAYIDEIEGNIDSADFGAVLMKGLAFAKKYQLTTHHMKLTQLPNGFSVYKKVPGDRQVEKYESIEGLFGEQALDAMAELAEKITAYGKETLAMDLPLSPIDYIKKKIADAGYTCGEITKRKNALVQNADGTWKKEAIKHNKKDVIKRFNGGSVSNPLPKEQTYDCVVMNRSGATGNSMHASRRFGDQRPRKMIILQAAKDPNNEVQIRGRIDRTGQVHRGEYFYVISPIPAEKKITMMLKQKLASLDANSVGSEKVASNKVEAEDMDNKYGDEVAHDFLVDHEEIHFQMDPAKQMKRDRKTGEYKGHPGLLYDLLLSMQRMTVADQETILTELEEAYAQKIEYLNQNGINDLATTTMNLDATTIDSAIMIKGKDNDALSEFAHDTTIERVEVNVLRKPLRSEDIHKKSKELGANEKHTKTNSQGEEEEVSYGDFIQQKARDAVDVLKEEKKQKQAESERKMEEDLKAQTPRPEGMTDEQYEQLIQNDPKMVGLKLRNANEYTRYEAQLSEQLQNTFYATKGLRPGWPYKIPLNESEQAESRYGRFIGFKVGKDGRPKSIEAVFATRDSRAMVSLPVVNMHKILESVVTSGGGFYDMFGKMKSEYGTEENRMASYDKWWDKMTPSNTSRSMRYMITGNILQAAGLLFAYRGTITTFTRKDAETGEVTVDKGLLLAEDFDPENFMVRTAVTKEDVWNNPGEFKDEISNISVYRDGDRLVVKFGKRGKEKLINHPVMYDDGFKALCEGEIEAETNQLVAMVSEKNAEEALDYLYRNYGFTQGHLLVMPDSTDKPDRIVYTNKPYKDVIESLKPKYRVYGVSSAQQKIDEALKEYRMDITNEDLKNKIRELVQLRQAFIREDYTGIDNPDLAWDVIINAQDVEKYERPVPNESPEEAIERREKRNNAFYRMEADKEELYSRGFEKGTLKHFKQGKTDFETIKKAFNEFNKDAENAKVAKKVFDIMKKLNVNFFFNEKADKDNGGATAGNMLYYNWRFMNEDWIPDQLKANTILHEMVHTVTVYAIRAVQNGQDHVIPGLVDAANQAVSLYNAICNNAAFRHQIGDNSWNYYKDYGAKYNAKEMLAELGANQTFRNNLAKVKVLIQQSFGQLSFSDVTNASTTPSGNVMSALDAAMDILNRLLDGFNADAYRKMWAGTRYGDISYGDTSYRTNESQAISTPEFKNWFGDWENNPSQASKVVDESGKPMVMYHGTPKGGFTKFDTRGSNFGLFGTGSYFTNAESVAEGYAGRGESGDRKVYSVYLNVRNPLDMDKDADVATWKSKAGRIGIPAKYFNGCKTNKDCFNALSRYCNDEGMNGKAGQYKSEAGEFITDFIEHSLGYDGITHEGGVISGGAKHRVFIVFRPNQVKSTNNTGAFNSENNDINFREADSAPVSIRLAEREAIEKQLDTMADELGININRVGRDGMPKGYKTAKGFYDTKAGEMTICMDNVTDMRDAMATVFHETVSHHGLRMLFGAHFNEAMARLYAGLDSEGRSWVHSYMERHGLTFGDKGIVTGMEEYMANLAERADYNNSVWNRIKEVFGLIVDKIFGTKNFTFTNRELNYILRASYEHLKNPQWLDTFEGKAKDALMKRMLGINETDPNRPTDPDGPGTGRLFRDEDTGVANIDYASDMTRKSTAIITENQDADMPVRLGMNRVMKEVGKKSIAEDEDYLMRHNLASSRAETQAHEFELFKFKPMLEQIRSIQAKLAGKRADKDGLRDAYHRILDYMYAVSGLERNRYKNAEIEAAKIDALNVAVKNGASQEALDKITKRYDGMKKDWSGLTSLMGLPSTQWKAAELRAENMVADFKKAVGDNAMLDELWDRVRACTDFSLEHARKYGLLTREEFERLHGTETTPRMWNYYLPLRGFSERTAEEEFNYSTFTQPSANSVVVKKMNGRWTQADNPVANILNIAETEIIQGNDNLAKQALYKFVLDAGKNTLLSAREPWFVKDLSTGKWYMAEPYANESVEDFEERMKMLREKDQSLAKRGRTGLKLDNIMVNKAHQNEHMIRLKVGGMEKGIWVNADPALARAVSGIGRAQNLQWLRRGSRVLSNLFTTYSLDFTAKNLIRDTIYSRIALLVKEDGKYNLQFRKNWIKNIGYGAFAYPMIRLAAKWESGELAKKANPTERERLFMDFMRDGGQTGYTIVNSVSNIRAELEGIMKSAGTSTGRRTIPILGHYAKYVRTLNEAFELLTRFTAYETSRQMGRSGERAASDAKEISVNFNRRGAQSGQGFWGNIAAYLGASHYFYNAGVQGFDNFLHLFKVAPKTMTATTAVFAIMGILTPMINGLLSADGDGDDDDKPGDWYWSLPEWVRRNNIILGRKGTYLAIPLPVEMRAVYGLGDIAASAFVFDKTANRPFGSVAGDMIATASGILPVNPIEGYNSNGNLGDAVIRAVAPDAGIFFVDWATNRDYTGRPLWKENPFSSNTPKSQSAYASTPKGIVLACQKLAEVSAGNIDIAPGLVRDFANNYGGGFWRAAEDVSKIVTGIIGNDPERPFRYDNIPFFSGFSGHIDEDRSNSFASNSLYEYKKLSEEVVRKINASAGTDEITAAMVYDDPDSIPEQYRKKANVQRILLGRDYVLGKMYRDGMNNEYEMAQYLSGEKAGQWHKTRKKKRDGVSSLKEQWKKKREEWAKMPHKTKAEKDAREAFSLQVQDAWRAYYNAEADLVDRLMEYEYGKK